MTDPHSRPEHVAAGWPDRRGFDIGAPVRQSSIGWTGVIVEKPADRPAVEVAQTYVQRDDTGEIEVVPARALELRRDI